MAKVRIDRTSIFFSILAVLFIWQQCYFFGLAIHDPFDLVSQLGDFTFLRGFSYTLRRLLFYSGIGYLAGIGAASLLFRSSIASRVIVSFLRLGLWLPVLLFFIVPQRLATLGIAAAALCSCYHYLTHRLLIGVARSSALINSARETLLQVFFLLLLAEIWWDNWLANWFKLFETATLTQSRAVGFGVLGVVVLFVFTVNWFCRYDFEDSAALTGHVASNQVAENWTSSFGAFIILVGCLLTWHLLSTPLSSPAAVLDASVYLFRSGEIWNDIRMTLAEILGGLSLSVVLALITSKVLSRGATARRSLSIFLPLTYLTPIILFMLSFFMFRSRDDPPVTAARIVFIGALSFYPLLRVYWGLRSEPAMRRILLGADYALPFAIVASLIGELYATTAGLGFVMVVATATNQPDKALVGFLLLIIAALVLSSIFRWICNRLSSFGRAEATVPAPTTDPTDA